MANKSFGEKLLQKHGWNEGSGLGKNNQGIKEPIKAALKFDTTGIGHDAAKEFTHHWWAMAYDRAASNIHVQKQQDGSVDVQSRRQKRKAKELKNKNKNHFYSGFVKAATLQSDGKLVSSEPTEAPQDKDNEEEEAPQPVVVKVLTDEELFKACKGLTAHKGARHGHRMSAKQARIAAMDEAFLKSQASS